MRTEKTLKDKFNDFLSPLEPEQAVNTPDIMSLLKYISSKQWPVSQTEEQ